MNIKKTLDVISTNIKVSPVEHIVSTFLSPLAIYDATLAIENYSKGKIAAGVALSVASLFSGTVSLLEQKWAAHNFGHYKEIRDGLKERGWSEDSLEYSIAYKFGIHPSRRQRRIIRLAAEDAGFENEIRDFFIKKGYKHK